MVPSDVNPKPVIALLSAATVAENGGPAEMVGFVGGQSLLELQIGNLATCGVGRFIVEVEHVTGALLQIADRNRKMGRSIDFIRSAADVHRLLQPDDRLWIQSDSLHIAPPILQQLLARPDAFIGTLDGRDENAAFERIDLNTRWAGLAMVDAATINALGDLPEGWSMTSSVLRQALQDKVALVRLAQQHIQAKDIRMVNSVHDVGDLNRTILQGRVSDAGGFVETRILIPIAAQIAPSIWHSSLAKTILNGSGIAFAFGALAMAVLGFGIAAISLGLVAIALNILRAIVIDVQAGTALSKSVPFVMWALLAMTVLITARLDGRSTSDGSFAGVAVVGLALLSHKMVLPIWAVRIMKSPALLAIMSLVTTPLIGFTAAMQWIAVSQLGVLVAATWAGNIRKKKT